MNATRTRSLANTTSGEHDLEKTDQQETRVEPTAGGEQAPSNGRAADGQPDSDGKPGSHGKSGPNGKTSRATPDPQRAALLAALWSEYHAQPCDETRNALVEAYQGFARDVARRFAVRLPRSVDRGDLTTAANFGLMSAIGGFDPERGVRFESYCELRVKGALLDELRTQDWLPRPWRQRLELQKRTLERLRSQEEREPNDQEVAAAMNMQLDQYQQVFGVGLPGTPSGSMPSSDGADDGMLVLEVVPDTTADVPGDSLTREELLSLVTQKLSEQEYRILYLRYWEGLPMREIGQLTNLSESRVCKIHARLIERLQDRLRTHALDD